MPPSPDKPLAAASTPSTGTALRGLRALGGAVARFGLWLPGAVLGLLLAGLVALWLWAATPGSFAQTLAWAERWAQGRSASWGELHTEGVEGSLRGGGRIEALRWSQGALAVQAEGVALSWSDALWTDALLGRGLHIPSLSVRHLRVDDQRAPTPTEPLTSLALPLPLSLGFAVQRFELTGSQPLSVSDIAGQYSFAALSAPTAAHKDAPALPDTPGVTEAHRLRIDSVQWADGRYHAQLSLGAQSPMPLALVARGDVHTGVPDGTPLHLLALAEARGTLAGPDASLDLSAQARPAADTPGRDTTALSLSARVLPWADQPLHSADVSAQSLNLAALWPGAPVTSLSGRLLAQPEGDAWRAQLQLDNAIERPADRQGLPLQALQAEVERRGERWTVSQLQARLGAGTLQGQASFALSPDGQGGSAVTDWQGELQASGIRPALLWSALAPGALDGQFSARAAPQPRAAGAVDLQVRVQASARQPAGAALGGPGSLDMKGQWLPAPRAGTAPGTHGVLELSELRASVAGARLEGQGRLDTVVRTLTGRLGLDVPGARRDWEGQAAHASGQGELRVRLDSAARALDWTRGLNTLPWWSPAARDALTALDRARADGGGSDCA